MRARWNMAVAMVLAIGFWAAPALAAIDFGDTTTRTIAIGLEDTPCVNPGGGTQPRAADPECLLFADDAMASFTNTITGTLQSTGMDTWQITIDTAVWAPVVTAATAGAGTAENISDVLVNLNSNTGAVDSDPGMTAPQTGTAVYWFGDLTGTAVGTLKLEALAVDADLPFFGTTGAPANAPLACSCAAPADGAIGPPVPASICSGNTIPEPGLQEGTANGSVMTAFAATRTVSPISSADVTTAVYAPLDWKLDEVPEPGMALLALVGGGIFALFGRKRG